MQILYYNNTTNLYPNVSLRRIDFVSRIDLNPDLISANCITLAFQLNRLRKNPELGFVIFNQLVLFNSLSKFHDE